MSSTSDIQAKWQERKTSGLSLGAAVGAEQDAGWGGRVQIYQNGRIYWHKDVGTHEVHGAILTKFLQWGAVGNSLATNRREFGFPTSDESRTPEGHAFSRFEWGAIYSLRVAGAVAIYGDFYGYWRRNMAMGYPLTEPLPAPLGGKVVYFQRGCAFSVGSGTAIYHCGIRESPRMGRPALTTLDQFTGVALQTTAIEAEVWQTLQDTAPNFMIDVWQSRFRLQAVKDRNDRVKLAVELGQVETVPNASIAVNMTLRLSPGAVMKERTLYDIGLLLTNGYTCYPIEPHSVYARTDWQNFGLIHATDLHVSRRCDQYYTKLLDVNLVDSAQRYNNYNEAFRALIIHANQLHAAGSLDLILATGDLVDYQLEEDEPLASGGNFAFMEKIIRGEVGSPAATRFEELHVPIFMTLGNHDYRRVPYQLLFDAHIPILPDHELKNFNPHNLTRSDAAAVQGGKPTLSSGDALEMVKPQDPGYFFVRMCRGDVGLGEASYTIKLGPHRIVMIDSKYDTGVLESSWDAFKLEVFGGDEQQRSFADGSPNQVGFAARHLDMVARAQSEAGNEGVVIVGVHGPPFGMKGSKVDHYFRETEHPTADKKDVIVFLARHDPRAFGLDMPQGGLQFGITAAGTKIVGVNWTPAERRAREAHPNWMASLGQPYFMKGSVADMLDSGTSQGQVDNLLRLCCGISAGGHTASRAVDVVLCGHGHHNVEYRARWNTNQNEMRYFTDFYTENPRTYYASRKAGVAFGNQRVMVVVSEGAPPNGAPSNDVQDHRYEGEEWRLRVPPYAQPLSKATNIPAWWSQHRPLILETAAVGPTESNNRGKELPGPSFQGYRVIQVAGQHIVSIHHVVNRGGV
jgi:hypothetical protein